LAKIGSSILGKTIKLDKPATTTNPTINTSKRISPTSQLDQSRGDSSDD
jgi:hypothetical protein